MLATLLTLAVISLSGGEVCTMPDGVKLVEPGKLNWALGDPTFDVPAGTRAIVTRIRPEQVPDVAEVKVYDGTDRLGWIAISRLTTVKSTIVFSPPRPPTKPVESALASVGPVKPYTTSTKTNPGNPASFFAMQDASRATQSAFAPETGSFGGYGGGFSSPRRSGGYYVGPRQPSGSYAGGVGSSHKGGHYVNPYTGNHYQRRR